MLDNHPPFKRVISDEATATDRQWLRMLDDVFESITFERLVAAGLDAQAVSALFGVVALRYRHCKEA